MTWFLVMVVFLFSLAGWFLFKEADSIGWRLLLTLAASGAVFWLVTGALALCSLTNCVAAM